MIIVTQAKIHWISLVVRFVFLFNVITCSVKLSILRGLLGLGVIWWYGGFWYCYRWSMRESCRMVGRLVTRILIRCVWLCDTVFGRMSCYSGFYRFDRGVGVVLCWD